MKNFTVIDFTNVCKFIACRSEDEFADMYDAVGFISRSYAFEKLDLAKRNFSLWWCGLDYDIQEKIVSYIKNFYSN